MSSTTSSPAPSLQHHNNTPHHHLNLFNPHFTSLHLAEFNIETGTEITHSVDWRDLLPEEADIGAAGDDDNNGESMTTTTTPTTTTTSNENQVKLASPNSGDSLKSSSSSSPSLSQHLLKDNYIISEHSLYQMAIPNISLMLPDGSHQNIQDCMVNLPNILEKWDREAMEESLRKRNQQEQQHHVGPQTSLDSSSTTGASKKPSILPRDSLRKLSSLTDASEMSGISQLPDGMSPLTPAVGSRLMMAQTPTTLNSDDEDSSTQEVSLGEIENSTPVQSEGTPQPEGDDGRSQHVDAHHHHQNIQRDRAVSSGSSIASGSTLQHSSEHSTTRRRSKSSSKTSKKTPKKEKLFGLVVYKHMQKMNLKRNARVKSLMLISHSKACIYLKKVLYACLNEIFAIDFLEETRSQEEKNVMIGTLLKDFYRSLCDLQIPPMGKTSTSTGTDSAAPVSRSRSNSQTTVAAANADSPLKSATESLCYSDVLERRLYSTVNLKFKGGTYPIKVCTTLPANSLDDPNISLVSLIDRFQEKTMLLYNCILYERKCVILGHNLAASELCNFVLATALLIPLLPEKYHLLARFFPYVSFMDVDEFLSTRGYVVGTTNPMFFERKEWFDCLCNLNEGTIDITCPEQLVEPTQEDQNFIQNMIRLISQMRNNSDNSPAYIEQVIQSHFRQYSLDIFRAALLMNRGALPTLEHFNSMEVEQTHPRIMPDITKSFSFKVHLFQKTRSFRIYKRLQEKQSSRLTLNLIEDHLLLRNAKQLSEMEILDLYQRWLRHVKTREQILEFLCFFPESRGGLESVFIPLLHSNEMVQYFVMSFIEQVESGCREGAKAVAHVNFYLLLLYNQIQKKLKNVYSG